LRAALAIAGWTAVGAALPGCWPDSSGIDPPADRFFFPTGMALTAGGNYLLVANSNFDLRYNTGTVTVVDLAEVERQIAECAGRCTEPRGEEQFILADSTVVIGSQATDVTVSPAGDRAYVSVRGNASLTWLELDEAAAAGERLLSCSPAAEAGAQRCDGEHEVIRTGSLWVPAEPYVVLADGNWVLTAHVTSGRVGVFDVSEGRAPGLARILDFFPEGANGLARHPATGWYYLVSRDSDRVYPFTIAMPARQAGEGPAVSTAPSIGLGGVNSGGSDCRSIAFAPDGSRAFVTNRDPSSVVVIDTALREDGGFNGQVLGTIELGSGPSKIAVQPLDDGRYLVLAVCFNAEELFVVDPDLRAVVDVLVTGMGPHTIVPDPARGRAYLLNFGESTVWVVDLNPRSVHFGRSLLSIGTPERPTTND
jgi:YVTN family beta-propeller protein